MTQRVLCFDPDAVLSAPSPALYPELGEQFFHFCGQLTIDDWAVVAATLADPADPPECWLLTAAGESAADVARKRGEIVEGIASASEGASFEARTLRTIRVRSGTGGDKAVDVEGQIDLDLQLDGAQEHADRLLLPLALRVLMERDRFLDTADQRRRFSEVRMDAEKAAIALVAKSMQETLRDAAARCNQDISRIEGGAPEGTYFDWAVVKCAASFELTALQQQRFPWLYRPNVDEWTLRSWLDSTTSNLKREWRDHLEALGRWRDEQLLLHNTKEPDRPFESSKSLEVVESEFANSIEELAEAREARAAFDFPAEADRTARDARALLMSSLRKRPTGQLFYWATGSLLAFMVLVASVLAEFGAGPRSGVPFEWPLIAASGVLSASLLALLAAQRARWTAMKKTLTNFEKLCEKAAKHAGEIKAEMEREVKRLLLGRNQQILRDQRADRQRRTAQHRFHLEQLERHIRNLDCVADGQWDQHGVAEGRFRLDPGTPVERNEVYFWIGNHDPQAKFVIGDEERSMLELDREGRYAGLARIVFEAAG